MTRIDLIQFRNDNSTNWESINPILASGELGVDTTNSRIRIGDGSTPWNLLPIFSTGPTNFDVIGFKWNMASSSPTLVNIDIDGNTITPSAADFNNHVIWGNIKRCVINPSTGVVTYGINARGDGLDLTGASGQVMVYVPPVYTKCWFANNYMYCLFSPIPLAGYELFPAFLQRGGTQAKLFMSAYETSGYLDGSTFKLLSATNKQPVTGAVSYTNLPNSGRLYIGDAETYANNIGTGWGIRNIWSTTIVNLLMYCEYKTLNLQTALGKGIVDLASGTGFAGLLTGALSADSNIAVNGTGTGTGTNGQTPIVWRGMENLWGNTWEWVIGINFLDAVHRVLKKDGTGVVSATLTAGNYDESASAPPNTSTASNGYVNSVFTDEVLKYMMMGATTTGSSSTYLCDYYYLRTASATPTNLLFGGAWNGGLSAGVGCRGSTGGAAASRWDGGARLEFLKR